MALYGFTNTHPLEWRSKTPHSSNGGVLSFPFPQMAALKNDTAAANYDLLVAPISTALISFNGTAYPTEVGANPLPANFLWIACFQHSFVSKGVKLGLAMIRYSFPHDAAIMKILWLRNPVICWHEVVMHCSHCDHMCLLLQSLRSHVPFTAVIAITCAFYCSHCDHMPF
jgi:hypothetical protein